MDIGVYRTIPPSRLRRATSLYTREALVRCKTVRKKQVCIIVFYYLQTHISTEKKTPQASGIAWGDGTLKGTRSLRSCRRQAVGKPVSTGHWHLMVRVPFPNKKEKQTSQMGYLLSWYAERDSFASAPCADRGFARSSPRDQPTTGRLD